MANKFFKSIVQVEILSEEDPRIDAANITNNLESLSLEEIGREIIEGDWSGIKQVISVEEVTPKEMAKLLQAQGSDPEYLGIHADGTLVEDE